MPKFSDWMQDEKLILIKGWVRSGLNDKQVAKNMGIAVSTFYKWKSEYIEFSDIIKKSKEVVDYEVENALFKRAKGQRVVLRKQRLDKDNQIINLEEEIYIPPDTSACKYWLNNRKPEKWKDRQEITINEFENFESLAEKLKIKEDK